MSFSIGIVGLPNVGKSTLFKALTKKQIDVANYPFCTIEPNVGIVEVPDIRLAKLTEISKSVKTIPTVVEFVDIAGLVKGASEGEGLGNQFLANIREVDAIAHMVRKFSDPDVVHVDGKIDPTSDIETVNTELVLKDLETITRRFKELKSKAKSGVDKEAATKSVVVEKIMKVLEEGNLASVLTLTDDEKILIKDLHLLTDKPVIYVVNVDEEEAASEIELIGIPAEQVIVVSAKVEDELVELTPEEKKEYLKELGLAESGLDKLIKKGYQILNLITFLTSGPEETRAWTVECDSKAPQAAGRIHTDFEKGFIRAEVCKYEDFVSYGEQGCKDKGLMGIEGKEYIVQDGDVMHFRFN